MSISPVSRKTYQDEILSQQRSDAASANKAQISDAASVDVQQSNVHRTYQQELDHAYKAKKNPKKNPPPSEEPPPVNSPPVEAAPPTEPDPPSDPLYDLATRYVNQYLEQTGHSLSTEEKTTLITQVYDFYSDASRAGRLEAIVFS